MKIVEDRNWVKPECRKGCPYFVDGENGNGILQCVRPFGEPCLAEGILERK